MALRETDIKPPASVVVVFRRTKEDEVLLVRHGPKAPRKEGVYGFPGGKPKPGETPEEAAIREFNEETGLEVGMDNLIPFPNSQDNIHVGVNQRETGTKSYAIRTFSVRDPNEITGTLRKTSETIPVWAKVRTLGRRRAQLMSSVEEIVSERVTND